MALERYNFSNEYQDLVLACKIKHPDKFMRFRGIFEPGYFSGLAAIETAFCIQEYEKKYEHTPSFKVLANFVFHKHARNNPEKAKESQDYVYKLARLDTTEVAYVLDTVRDFARERAVLDAVNKVLGAQTSGKEVEGGIVKMFEKAVEVGRDTNDIGLSLVEDVEAVVEKVTRSDYGVPTGFQLFDDIWRTGWAPGWLIVPLAPPKSFKTAFCINLALNMAGPTTRGTVFYYACEISEELAMLRALYNVSQQRKDDLFSNPHAFAQVCRESLRVSIEGDILFKHFPAKTVQISDIKAHAKMITHQSGVKPCAIVVDYAETIRSASAGNKNMPDWRQQAEIYTDARAMGHELGCPIIMPDRVNKDAVEREVPLMSNFQGAFEKAGIVDISIALCGTEAERLQNVMRYFVLLNRHGPQYLHFRGSVDPETMKMTVDEQLEYSPEKAEKKNYHARGEAPKTDTDLPTELQDP